MGNNIIVVSLITFPVKAVKFASQQIA